MTYVLGGLAGLLTTLSPCVLPILPLVARSALTISKWGPATLALGMVFSFTLIGTSLLAAGEFLGLEQDQLRHAAAILIIISGTVFVFPHLSHRFTQLVTPFSQRADSFSRTQEHRGLFGQFVLGLLIGLIWSPCTGPTLGAAVGLAGQEETYFKAMSILFVFSIGAIVPLIAATYWARSFMQRREDILNKIEKLKPAMGILFVLVGVGILLNYDKVAEAWLLAFLPDWLNDLTTRF